MAIINLLGAVLSAGLNLVLLPLFNIQGAAIATLLTQSILTLLSWRMGMATVPVSATLGALARHLGCALVMGACIYYLNVGPLAVRLAIRVLSGAIIFGGLCYLVDAEFRELAKDFLARALHKLGWST
jgi:O-antigen/teichoic acid export membrane protein